jgi:hypothetical protein
MNVKALVALVALLHRNKRVCSNRAAEGLAGKGAHLYGLQTRWNGQGDEALGRRLRGRGWT